MSSRVVAASTLATTATALNASVFAKMQETGKNLAEAGKNIYKHGSIFPDEDQKATDEYYAQQADSLEDVAALDLSEFNHHDAIFAEIRDLKNPEPLVTCEGTVIGNVGFVAVNWTSKEELCKNRDVLSSTFASFNFDEDLKKDKHKIVLRREKKSMMQNASESVKRSVKAAMIDSVVYGAQSVSDKYYQFRSACAGSQPMVSSAKKAFLQSARAFLKFTVAVVKKTTSVDQETLNSILEQVEVTLKNDDLVDALEKSDETMEAINKQSEFTKKSFQFYWDNKEEVQDFFFLVQERMDDKDYLISKMYALMNKFVDATDPANKEMLDMVFSMFKDMDAGMEDVAKMMEKVQRNPEEFQADPMKFFTEALTKFNFPDMKKMQNMMEKMQKEFQEEFKTVSKDFDFQKQQKAFEKLFDPKKMEEQMKKVQKQMETPEFQKQLEEMNEKLNNMFNPQDDFGKAFENLFDPEAMEKQLEDMEKNMKDKRM